MRADGKETRAAWRVWGVQRHRTGRQGSGLNADEQVSSCSSRGVPSQVSGSGHGGHSAPRPHCEPGRRRHGHCSATAGQCWAPTRVTSRPREPPDGPSAPEPRPPCPLRCPRVLTGRSAPPGSCRPTRGRHGLDTPLREVGATFAVPPALKGKALALRGTETTTRRPGPGRPAQRVTPAASANLQLLPPEQPDGAVRATGTRVPVQSPPGGGAGQAGKTNMFSRGSWTERGHRAMSPRRGGARWLVLPPGL